jgi:hypothetical protein
VPALPTRSPMTRVQSEIDTFTSPEGRRRRVYRPGRNDGATTRVVNSKCSATVQWRSGASRSPGERSDTRDREDALREDPHIAHAHAGYDLVLCELICASRKHNLRQQPATNQPDGQIT